MMLLANSINASLLKTNSLFPRHTPSDSSSCPRRSTKLRWLDLLLLPLARRRTGLTFNSFNNQVLVHGLTLRLLTLWACASWGPFSRQWSGCVFAFQSRRVTLIIPCTMALWINLATAYAFVLAAETGPNGTTASGPSSHPKPIQQD